MVLARDTIKLIDGTIIRRGEKVPEYALERLERRSPNLLDSFAEINSVWKKISKLPVGTILPEGTEVPEAKKKKIEKKVLDEVKTEKKIIQDEEVPDINNIKKLKKKELKKLADKKGIKIKSKEKKSSILNKILKLLEGY